MAELHKKQYKFGKMHMAADKDTVRNIRSATEEAADTAKTAARTTTEAARTGANLARETVDRGADTAKKVAEQANRGIGDLLTVSAETSQDVVRQVSANLDMLLQVGSAVASGYQSILSEWSNYTQQAAQRNADALNAALRARNPRDLFSVQGDLLRDTVQGFFSTGARVSELSAQVASEAVEKLDARAQ